MRFLTRWPKKMCLLNLVWCQMKTVAKNCVFFHGFVCFGGVFVPLENFSITYGSRHHNCQWKLAGQRIWALNWPLSSEGSLGCHTYCDTDHPFVMVISDVWTSVCLRSVAAGIRTPNLPHVMQSSNWLCHHCGFFHDSYYEKNTQFPIVGLNMHVPWWCISFYMQYPKYLYTFMCLP